MKATESILNVWNKFKYFPMENFTKVWYANQNPIKRQRSVPLMKQHYEQYKIAGNCFDLALWLLDEFRSNQIQAFAIGHDLFTEHAHVAVIVLDENNVKYLCDLGDQWIQPICIDVQSEAFHSNDCHGFFPGATIQVLTKDNHVEILYKRPSGKVSKQTFDLCAIEEETLLKAAEFSQTLIKTKPLLECRQYGEEVVHWEFYNWNSFTSSMGGKVLDEELYSIEDWATRIHLKTGYPYEMLLEVLSFFEHYKCGERSYKL